MHPSRHVDTPMRYLRRREAIKMHPLLFYSPCSRWHTCALGGGGATEAHLQAQLPFKHMFACTHTHMHKAVNRRPLISHLFLTSSQLDRDHQPLGEWLGVTPAAAHTHAHTLVIFILASVSFHPATQFHLSALLHIILSLFYFFPSFLINWCCLRYYLCHTNQINGRHSFLKGKLLKKMSLSRAVALRRISDLLPLFCFFFIMWVFCFVFRSVFNT